MKKILFIVVIALVFLAGCKTSSNVGDVIKQSSEMIAENQKKLETGQPAPIIEYSLERENLIKRTKIFNDPNKVSYIYLLSDFGTIISFHVLKGKVSNLSSYLVPDDTVVRHSMNNWAVTVQAPDIDGSYGTNGDGIFFFDTAGTYIEWNGNYLLCDKPLKVNPDSLVLQSEGE